MPLYSKGNFCAQQDNRKMNIATIEERLKQQRANSTNRKKYIGWISSYAPEEIIIAAGFQPYRIMGNTSPLNLSSTYLIGNLCSFVHSCLESALKGEYDFLSGAVIVNDSDAMKSLYGAWVRNTKTPFVYLIDIPRVIDDLSCERYKEELSNFISNIEEFFHVKITSHALKDAMELCNKTRSLLNEVSDLRKSDPPLVSSSDFLRLCKLSMLYPKEEFNDLISIFLKELKNTEQMDKAAGHKRILLMGSFQDQPEFLDMIEKHGCQVVCEDMCTQLGYFRALVDETGESISALASRYLNKSPSACMTDFEKRSDYVKGLIDEFKIEAVIYYILKFDDPYLFEFPDMKAFVGSLKLPILRIESEHNSSASGQIKTRIQAFVETLVN